MVATGEATSVEKKVAIYSFKAKDTVQIAELKFKTDAYHRFQLSAGLAYTTSLFVQSSAKEENGQITISNNAQQFRLILGVHVYLGKGLFVHDNSFPGRFTERISAFAGVGIPKPLENVYLGFGYDVTPD